MLMASPVRYFGYISASTSIVLECYREKDNKNKEVRVVISYNTEMATEMAKRLIRQELEKKGEQLRSKFDQIQK